MQLTSLCTYLSGATFSCIAYFHLSLWMFPAYFTYLLSRGFPHMFLPQGNPSFDTDSPHGPSHALSDCWLEQSAFRIFHPFTGSHFPGSADGEVLISCCCFLQVFLQLSKLHPYCVRWLAWVHSKCFFKCGFVLNYFTMATSCTIKQFFSSVDLGVVSQAVVPEKGFATLFSLTSNYLPSMCLPRCISVFSGL